MFHLAEFSARGPRSVLWLSSGRVFNVLFADEPVTRVFGWSSSRLNHRKQTLLFVRILITLTRFQLVSIGLAADCALFAFESNVFMRRDR
jgi:hypothetical protein